MKTKTITTILLTLFLTSIMALDVKPVNASAGVLETLTIQANNLSPTYSTTVLQEGWSYVIEVSGTWSNGPVRKADAKYYSDDNWETYGDEPYPGADSRQIELVIDNERVDWGPYTPDHTYYTVYEGKGHSASFLAFMVWEKYDYWYGDNSGSLTVNLYVSGQLPLYKGWGAIPETGEGKVKWNFIDRKDKLILTVILKDALPNYDYRVFLGPYYWFEDGTPHHRGTFLTDTWCGIPTSGWGFAKLYEVYGYLTTDEYGNGVFHANIEITEPGEYEFCIAINQATVFHTPLGLRFTV